MQGKVAVIKLAAQEGLVFGGSLNERPLHFFRDENGIYNSLQGVHALIDPGLHTLVLTGTLPAEATYFGAAFSYSQAVLIRNGG